MTQRAAVLVDVELASFLPTWIQVGGLHVILVVGEPAATWGELRERLERSRARRWLVLVQAGSSQQERLADIAGLVDRPDDVRALAESVQSREAALDALRAFVAERLGVEDEVGAATPTPVEPPPPAPSPRRRDVQGAKKGGARRGPSTGEFVFDPAPARPSPLPGGEIPPPKRGCSPFARWSRRSLPEPERDDVTASVFCPEGFAPGGSVLVQAALDDADAAAIDALARGLDAETTRRGWAQLQAPVRRGQTVHLDLHVPGLRVDEPVQSTIWRGTEHPVTFAVTARPGTTRGAHVARLTVRVDGLPVGRIAFRVELGDPAFGPADFEVKTYRKAFASYCRADEEEVLKRLQLRDQLPYQVFVDVLSIRSGEDWAARLQAELESCDVFLLFWSKAASESQWVERESRLAAERQRATGSPDVLPYVLEVPFPRPPPALSHLQFDDAVARDLLAARVINAGR